MRRPNETQLDARFYKTHKEQAKAATWKFRCKQKGITVERYNELFELQNGLCAICNKPELCSNKKLAVDHNHITGKVRSLLCTNCNLLIGQAKESIEILLKAIDYLKEHSNS